MALDAIRKQLCNVVQKIPSISRVYLFEVIRLDRALIKSLNELVNNNHLQNLKITIKQRKLVSMTIDWWDLFSAHFIGY